MTFFLWILLAFLGIAWAIGSFTLGLAWILGRMDGNDGTRHNDLDDLTTRWGRLVRSVYDKSREAALKKKGEA